MDADTLFKKYLEGWPDPWILWPDKGRDKMRDFFKPEPADPHDFAPIANDLLDFIFINNEEGHTASEWVIEYFKTERGREMAAKHMAKHEPILMASSFGVSPLKELMDGFIEWYIFTEVKPCLT